MRYFGIYRYKDPNMGSGFNGYELFIDAASKEEAWKLALDYFDDPDAHMLYGVKEFSVEELKKLLKELGMEIKHNMDLMADIKAMLP